MAMGACDAQRPVFCRSPEQARIKTAHRKSGLPDLRIVNAHPGQALDARAGKTGCRLNLVVNESS
jgi:hypothetical protein